MQNQHTVLYLHLKDTGSVARLKMKAAVSTAVNSVHFCSANRFFFAWTILCFNTKTFSGWLYLTGPKISFL